MTMHKWNIQFLGQRQYLAPDLDTARKMATDDLKSVPPQIGLSINGHMDLGPVVIEEE